MISLERTNRIRCYLTSKSEYRMTLRPENSDMRLTAKACTAMLVWHQRNVSCRSARCCTRNTTNQIIDVLKGCVLSTQGWTFNVLMIGVSMNDSEDGPFEPVP
ncbi:uncharacterized protein EV420DRAFT_635862 [Desarmillaria tabescens]|uniref:Uncharacterized protein n=1 Tax=Armillaria tabescens TaxID=1929756 RepID=A0AA39K1S4_ARMTA|nr:uncharacterized protein EV420DRAFT_635862 [Desarmillaria tabescens]KAK0453006.1 hypothetical protein EV420DRAFT_635862 [Desarmillaria tabescens]